MRFRCQIGTGCQIAPPLPPGPLARPVRVAPPQRVEARRRALPVRGAIAGAVLLLVAGCAAFDSKIAKPWKIEPVFNVTHTMQSSQAYYTLGRYFDGSQAWDRAIDAYRKAIADDAHNVEAHNALGVALARSGDLALAETALRQAISIDPERAHVRNNLGYVLLLADRPLEAVAELREAVRRDDGNTTAMTNLSEAMRRADAVRVAAPAAPQVDVPHVDVEKIPALQVASTPAVPVVPAVTREPLRLEVIDQPSVRFDAPANVGAAASAATPAPVDKSSKQHALRLEISNGNGFTGMAARVGRWLAAQGMPTDRLSNHKPFDQQRTVVQYGDGHEEAAQRVARSLPATAQTESLPTSGLRSDVRVVLGRDWVRTGACLARSGCLPAEGSVTVATSR